jgi:RNA polymerase sigma-70 factor (ECF subfamily)
MPYDIDDSLMTQFASGDLHAFAHLMDRHKQHVYLFILSKTGDRDWAVDLTQDVFIKLFRSVRSYKAVGKFKAWLFRIARNIVIDAMRMKKRASVLSLDHIEQDESNAAALALASDENPAATVESRELYTIIRDALELLPEEQRTAFMLCQFQGMRYKEIADIQDCPEGTVKSRIHKAVQHIRDVLRTNDLLE